MTHFEIIDLKKENISRYKIKNQYFLGNYDYFTNQKSKLQTKASYVLLKKLCKDHYNIDVDKEEIMVNKYGKPYFKHQSIFFNISHSENLAAVCISDKPVGIDIQVFSKPNKRVVAKYFDFPSKLRMTFYIDKTKAFTMGWTKYESVLKLFSNLELKKGKVKTKFYQVKDCTNLDYFVAVSKSK